MLCISCGTEMRLVRVQPDDTMMVKGYEYQTFECPSCQETERRLTFRREPTPQPVLTAPDDKVEAVPPGSAAQEAAPPVSLISAHQDEAVPTASADSKAPDQPAPPVSPAADRTETPPSRWARAVAKLRGIQERGL